jgi:ketol-acid reductoisomerase
MAKIDFGGVVEDVVTREEFPLAKAREVLKNEIVAVIGYGVQGPAQALNMSDRHLNSKLTGTKQFQMVLFRARLCLIRKRRQQKEP